MGIEAIGLVAYVAVAGLQTRYGISAKLATALVTLAILFDKTFYIIVFELANHSFSLFHLLSLPILITIILQVIALYVVFSQLTDTEDSTIAGWLGWSVAGGVICFGVIPYIVPMIVK